jgi:hypothetical protein
MNLSELENLAKAAWIGDDEDAQIELQFQGETILAMIELMKEMGECLEQYVIEEGATGSAEKALAKFKEMTK